MLLLLNSNTNFDIDTVSDRMESNASVYKGKIPQVTEHLLP